MQIVPLEDDLVIQARVSPSDIAFIRVGQTASVKIDAYDYTIYGDLAGQLAVAELVDVLHGRAPAVSGFKAAISANSASVRAASSGSIRPIAWPTCTMT